MKKITWNSFIFGGYIGILPNILGDYSFMNWQWWAVFISFLVLLMWRDKIIRNENK